MITNESIDPASAVPVSRRDRELARVARLCLMAAPGPSRATSITVHTDAGEAPSLHRPPQALHLLGEILGAMSEGRAIAVVPSRREFRTVEAAHVLNVSRPFVCGAARAPRSNDWPTTRASGGSTTEMAGHARCTTALDPCVRHPIGVADALMNSAAGGLFAAKRTEQIEAERVRAFGCDRRGRPHPDDPHVLPAAIAGHTDCFVTFRLRAPPSAVTGRSRPPLTAHRARQQPGQL